MKYILTALFIMMSLTGCNEPTIDATTDESMKTTAKEIRDSLPKEKQETFEEAVKFLMFNQISLKEVMIKGKEESEKAFNFRVREALHGKTADQVISEAKNIREQRQVQAQLEEAEAKKLAEEKKEQARIQAINNAKNEIKALENKKVNAIEAQRNLKNFEVVSSRFYKKKGLIGQEPIIELTVVNNTSTPVSRAYFEGTIATPGRAIPWFKDTFNYTIPGGLEPGEKAEWSLAPNMFSDWGTAKSPKDAVFTVTVRRIDDAQGKALFSLREFTETDEKRLQELKAKFDT